MKKAALVTAALLIQLCLGTVYAFSVFVNPLKAQLGWSLGQVSLAFTICLASFTLFMIIAGRLQDRWGPRLTASVGGVLLGLGLILAGRSSELVHFYFTYGVMAGAGIGFGYVVPISTLVKWFPRQKALMSGIAVFGFGSGPLLFAPIATAMIAAWGVRSTLALTGTLFFFLVTGGAQFMVWPTQESPETGEQKAQATGEIWKSWRFWWLWIYFFIGAGTGLMLISQASPILQDLGALTPTAAAGIVGILSLCNGAGRLFWGLVGDRVGYEDSLKVIFAILAITLLLLPVAAGKVLLTLGLGLAVLSFGGLFSLMPALTSSFFGINSLGRNYGLVFTAYGSAAVVGPLAIAGVYTLTQGYTGALVTYGIACALAFISLIAYKPRPLGHTVHR